MVRSIESKFSFLNYEPAECLRQMYLFMMETESIIPEEIMLLLLELIRNVNN